MGGSATAGGSAAATGGAGAGAGAALLGPPVQAESSSGELSMAVRTSVFISLEVGWPGLQASSSPVQAAELNVQKGAPFPL